MTELTLHLSAADEATLRIIAEEHKMAPEAVVLQGLRVNMRDYMKGRMRSDHDPEIIPPMRGPQPEWG